jgi:hypothetical protein
VKAALLPAAFRLSTCGFPPAKTPDSRIFAGLADCEPEVVMQWTQEEAMTSKRTQELDSRSSDGLEVTLLWEPETSRVKVAVFDAKTGDDFEVEVSSNEAMDAFHHPYAYAANHGVHFLAGTRTPSDPVYA